MTRHSVILKVANLRDGSRGPDTMYVVDLFEDNQFVGRRELPNKSQHYAQDVSENWDNGIIQEP